MLFIRLYPCLPMLIWQVCCKVLYVRWCYPHVVIPVSLNIIVLPWHASLVPVTKWQGDKVGDPNRKL